MEQLEVWFVTGSQDLYGETALRQVADNASASPRPWMRSPTIPVHVVVYRPIVTSAEGIRQVCLEANAADACIGDRRLDAHVLAGPDVDRRACRRSQKPLPASAHAVQPRSAVGDDRHGLHEPATRRRTATASSASSAPRLRGCPQDRRRPLAATRASRERIGGLGARGRAAWREAQQLRVARFGDNMRRGRGHRRGQGRGADPARRRCQRLRRDGSRSTRSRSVPDADVDALAAAYDASIYVAPISALRRRRAGAGARARPRGSRSACAGSSTAGGFGAFTDTFEDLDGLMQLPGIARPAPDGRRLRLRRRGRLEDGGRSSDSLKVMAAGLPGGTSFMEDYTYHLDPAGPKVLGAHMLEVCPTIAATGRRARSTRSRSVARSIRSGSSSTAAPGPALVVALARSWRSLPARRRTRSSIVEPMNRCRDCPSLGPSGDRGPTLRVAAEAWLHAGGSHHTVLTQAIGRSRSPTLPRWPGSSSSSSTPIPGCQRFVKEMRWNQAYYHLARGL